ncbi:hypothetical protein GCM10023213_07280 [Prosthecobacter algae]|uniref:Prepilin-type processing-associated H-X9-DG protein n=2 Tax=Prosthecobacter algae TaxID=1144682 RepID=A0ABP9NVQ3_9BACT
MNFKSKFKYLPGDSPMFTPAGNASGLVRGCWSGCGPSGESQGWNFNAEIAAFWKHVSDAGFVEENYIFTANDGRPGINVPIAAYNEKPDTGVYAANPNDDISTYLNVCSHPSASDLMCADSASHNAFSAMTTLAIDKKLDDGRPRAGAVTVMTGPWNNMGGGPGCVTGNSNSDNATYDITSSNKNACNLRLRLNKN